MQLDLFAWKVCTSCQIKKKIEEFGKNKSQRDGLHYYCKKCVRDKSKQNTSTYKEYQKQWRENNKDSIKNYQKKYKLDNKDKINEYQRNRPLDQKRKTNCSEKKKRRDKERRQTQSYKSKRSLYVKQKYRSDIQFQTKKKFEAKLNYLLEKNDVIESVALIGCTIPEYKAYLEQCFKEGMTFENYGTVWNIHRIVPFIQWDLTNPEEAALCHHYSNSTPMFVVATTVNGVEHIE